VALDPDKLTAALADRLAAIVPAGFHVRAGDGLLWYTADSGRFPGQLGDYQAGEAGTYVRASFDARGPADEDRVAGAAAQALDELQDYVDEASHEPWPGHRTPPQAQALVRDQTLHLWYSDPDGQVVLACVPIPLASLRR
jgi:hypothetical protein